MNKPTRQFYTRFRIYTSIAPAYLTGLFVFLTGWYTYNAPAGQLNKPVEVCAGMLFFIACTGGFEILSRLGFQQFHLQRYAAKLSPELKQQLVAVFGERPAAETGLSPLLVELGEVPMLMVGGAKSGQLWISSHTLATTPVPELQHLLAHERAHLVSDTMLDRVLINGGYWWICGVTVMMLVKQPLLGLLWLLVAAGVFLRVNAIRLARLELRADKMAVQATSLEGYSRALAGHLAQFESGTNHEQVRERLKALGVSVEEISRILGS